jgi:phosphopantetheinyl transferase
VGAGVPEIRVLDSRTVGADEAGLRAWARAETAAAGAPYAARSYRYPYALVAWHRAPVGVDIERIEPCDEAFADLICTPAERGDVALRSDRDAYLTTLWSGKEALAKALGDALLYEPARLESPLRWPGGASKPWRAARCDVPVGHVAWVVWR